MAKNLEFLKTFIRPFLPRVKDLTAKLEPKNAKIVYSFIDEQGKKITGEKPANEILDEFLLWFK